MSTTMHQIFVFGTLKDGFPNFAVNDGTRVSGSYLTQPKYELYLVGPRYTPWIIPDQGEGMQISGEVYEVDDNGLARMDELERINYPDGYQRASINVVNKQSEEVIAVFIYMKKAEQLDRSEIQDGPLPEYSMAHAAKYQPRTG
jgi:gamma-glutamylaminecyclotransferase